MDGVLDPVHVGTFTEEKLYCLFEELTGARFTTSYTPLWEPPVIYQRVGWDEFQTS